ncbi:MAG: 50S ribosomal protein L21 [Planctomycetes bacterium]|nr:50S ribosomal protein L21 [Planctomycetota bacterium]
MYAIIRDRTQQHKVTPGQSIELDLIDGAEPGKKIEFAEVLLVADGEDVRIGRPLVAGAKVTGEVERESKGEKLEVLKYRRREMYKRRIGHRQHYTVVKITQVEPGAKA